MLYYSAPSIVLIRILVIGRIEHIECDRDFLKIHLWWGKAEGHGQACSGSQAQGTAAYHVPEARLLQERCAIESHGRPPFHFHQAGSVVTQRPKARQANSDLSVRDIVMIGAPSQMEFRMDLE